jgi:carnitine-CoA ligase
MSDPTIVEILTDLGCPQGTTYRDVLARMRGMPSEQALLTFEDVTTTYGEMLDQIGGAAAHLEELGLGRGSRIAYLLDPQPAALVTWLAVTSMGAVLVPLYKEFEGDLLDAAMRRLDIEAVVADSRRIPELRRLAADSPTLRSVIPVDGPYSDAITRGHDIGFLMDRDYPQPGDDALILSTSGTTGTPKGVRLQQSFSGSSAIAARKWGVEGPVRSYISTSWGHGFVGFVSTLAIWQGGSIVVAPRFSASRFWGDVRRHGCDYVQIIGTQAQMLMNQAPTSDDDAHAVRYLVSTGMPAHLWEAFEKRFAVRVWEFYSGTDTGGSFLSNPGRYPIGSIGRPWDEAEARVTAEDGSPTPVGEVGFLSMRPTGGRASVRYSNEDPGTAGKVDDDGWVWLGDLVRQDDHGNFYFVDRGRDVIRRRGVNIPPAIIEEALESHPGVGTASAFGVPSDLGEDDVKVVVVRLSATLTENDVAAFAVGVLPGNMQPRYIEFRDELPLTVGTAKIQRYKLRDSWRTPQTWDAQTGAHLDDANRERAGGNPVTEKMGS